MTEARRFTGGRIFTGRRFVEALLVEDGRVAAVGSSAEVRRASPSGCAVEDLAGGLAIPGLVDAHLHIVDVVRSERGLPLEGLRSREELGERLRRWAETHPSGPIIGRGWSTGEIPDGGEPTRRDVESAVADRPVVLYHASGHAALVNGLVLNAVGYGPGAPDPPNGKLGRGPDGSPNGLLYERAMAPVVKFSSSAFPPDPEAIETTLRTWASLGLTSVGTLNTDPEEVEVLASLARASRLPVRVRAYLRFARLADTDPRTLGADVDPTMLAVRGTKAFADGAFGPRTAWLSAPYRDRPDSSGTSTLGPADLVEVLAQTAASGLTPAIHAIGDRGLASVLAAVEQVAPQAQVRVEHASLVPPELLPPLARARPVLVVQPGFVWSDAWLADRLGADRVRFAYPFRTLLERGHRLVGSSDAPYDPVDPWRGLAAAVRRTSPTGGSANPDPAEALSPEQAVQMYTAHAGAAFGEDLLGSLEPGAPADLVVVDGPDLLWAIDRGAPGVRATWRGGSPTYVRSSPPGA
jgi:predicted amidohydrolase YtcJ